VQNLVALKTLMVSMDLLVEVLDKPLGLCKELLLGYEHAVEASHVRNVELEVG
jgi:hypothetical protein